MMKRSMIMTIYDRISELLKQQHHSRKDLSIATGISYNTLTSLFQRQSDNMKLSTIQSIADFLNVTVEYLITGVNTKNHLKEQSVFDQDNIRGEDRVEQELIRIAKKLNQKHKTILLAKAYELEDSEKNSKE